MKALMVMYDSLRRDLLSVYGGPIPASNFERLAAHTVCFDKSYVGSLPCMPARRELHTGRYNFLHRSWGPMEPYDDSMPEINNATTLNMLDVENGATRLGNSDIYINAANNFQTNECLIAEIGPSKGIGKVISPQVGSSLVYQAAVTPGNLYQAFKQEAVKQFPSGKFALALAGDYYQFHVESEIMKEEKRVGAVIRFALINPEADGLPAYDSTIGTVVNGSKNEIVYEFPKGTEFQYDNSLEDIFNISTEGGVLKVSMSHGSIHEATTPFLPDITRCLRKYISKWNNQNIPCTL